MAAASKRCHSLAFASSEKSSARPRLAPIFAPPQIAWISKTASLWHLTYGKPVGSNIIAIFDLDGVILKDKSPTLPWWDKSVPNRLRQLAHNGTSVYIVTNQGLKPDNLRKWANTIEAVLNKLDCPCRVFAATGYDWMRKPMPGMMDEIKKANDVPIDLEQSFFVGDAAGRHGDHSDSDRKWAINTGVRFLTPEQFFLFNPTEQPYTLKGFDPRAFLTTKAPLFMPTNTPLFSATMDQPEMIINPGSGKTFFYHRFLGPKGYLHINNDLVGSMSKCMRMAEQYLNEGKSVVIDNTSPSRARRSEFIAIAQRQSAPVRCFRFMTGLRESWHQNLFRAFAPSAPHKSALIPDIAYHQYRRDFQEPTLDEGFAEIKKICPNIHEMVGPARTEYSMFLALNGRYHTLEHGHVTD